MELKKSDKANLEKRKGLYLEIGLVTILAIALVAFNIKSYDMAEIEIVSRTASDEIEEQIIQTSNEEPPPPPEPEAPEVVTEVAVVENDAEIEHEATVFDASADKATNVEVQHVEVKVEEEEKEEEIFMVVEEMPSYPGGAEALYKYLRENIKYPAAARDNNITGRVGIEFVVEKDGSISGARVVRDIGGGCGAEALRVVKAMPKWTPGKQRGKAVRTKYTLPVSFNLK